MFKIVIIACFVSMACGTQYAYFDNNLVEFEDAPAPAISLPYPYAPQVPKVQESKVVKLQPTAELNPAANHIEAQSAIVSAPTSILSCFVTTALQLILAPFRLICALTTKFLGLIKRVIMYVVTSIPALIFGSNLSAICKFFNIDPISYLSEMSSFVGPDRLKRATEFVETAINKYRELQNS